jgi:hypothetical protein
MTRTHWMERVEMIDADHARHYLGEDDRGELWAPSRTQAGWWDRRFCWWKPTHWPYYLRSRIERQVAFIEWMPEPPAQNAHSVNQEQP